MNTLPQPPAPTTWMMAPRACTKCGAPMPTDFTTAVVECRCPDGHESWYYDRPNRAWRRAPVASPNERA